MKPRLLLLASCLVLVSSLVMKANGSGAPSALPGTAGAEPGNRSSPAAASRATPSLRGLLRVLRPRVAWPRRERPGVRRLPHGDGQLSALAGQRGGQVSAAAVPAPTVQSGCRRSAVPADRRRRFPGQRRQRQRLQQSSAERPRSGSRSRCPLNIKLIDPATNQPSTETFVDVWRMVPTVNDVALTGPDGVNPWPRGPNITGGYQLDGRLATLQEQALGALRQSRAGTERRRRSNSSTTWPPFSACSSRTPASARSSDAVRAGDDSAAGSGSAAQRARAAGQGRVRARLRHVPRRAGTIDHAAPGRLRFHDIATQCPRPVDAARPGPLRLCALSGPHSREMRGPTRLRFMRDLASGPRSAVRAPIRAARC